MYFDVIAVVTSLESIVWPTGVSKKDFSREGIGKHSSLVDILAHQSCIYDLRQILIVFDDWNILKGGRYHCDAFV